MNSSLPAPSPRAWNHGLAELHVGWRVLIGLLISLPACGVLAVVVHVLAFVGIALMTIVPQALWWAGLVIKMLNAT